MPNEGATGYELTSLGYELLPTGSYRSRKRYRYKKALSVAAMPTFKIIRRPKRGPSAAGGNRKRKSSDGGPRSSGRFSCRAAVVSCPGCGAVVSAMRAMAHNASAFPDPAVSSGAALTV